MPSNPAPLIIHAGGSNFEQELRSIISTDVTKKSRKLNYAISARLQELLAEKQMTQYQLYLKSGVPKSTIHNVIHCSYNSVKIRIVHELCQGLGINLETFFASPLFGEENLEP